MKTSSTIRALHELIAALDRRFPQTKRAGEAAIARDSASLKEKALERLAELEVEPRLTTLEIAPEPRTPTPAAHPMIPGAREPGRLTRFGSVRDVPPRPDGSNRLDTVTRAERQREGGGAAGHRRPASGRTRWTGVRPALHQLSTATHAFVAWSLGTRPV